MIWFGSSSGVALCNMFPEARSVGLWLRHGWPIAVAYTISFFVMLAFWNWHPDAPVAGYAQPAGAHAYFRAVPVPTPRG